MHGPYPSLACRGRFVNPALLHGFNGPKPKGARGSGAKRLNGSYKCRRNNLPDNSQRRHRTRLRPHTPAYTPSKLPPPAGAAPAQSIPVLPTLSYFLSFLHSSCSCLNTIASNKKTRSTWPRAKSSGSLATRLSSGDPWLSVPRLLVVWLCQSNQIWYVVNKMWGVSIFDYVSISTVVYQLPQNIPLTGAFKSISQKLYHFKMLRKK